MAPIQALIFDVFGTVADWRSSIVAELENLGKRSNVKADTDWGKLAQQWRNGYFANIERIAAGAPGTLNVDIMHRQILNDLLKTPEWSHIDPLWDENSRQYITLSWHRLHGWPDVVEGLIELKKQTTIVALSNGNLSLLIDMAKYANLPWDAIFSTELFDTFKPNPKAYQETMRHLSLPPKSCAMVSAHMWDLRAAASHGMTTIYVRRPKEDLDKVGRDLSVDVKSKAEGGEVDYVVDYFIEVVKIVTLDSASGK